MTVKERMNFLRTHKNIVPGKNFVPAAYRPKKAPSLAWVRRRLSKFPGSLSQTIAEVRED